MRRSLVVALVVGSVALSAAAAFGATREGGEPRTVTRCRARNPVPRRAGRVAATIVEARASLSEPQLHATDRVIGAGDLWVLRTAVQQSPGFDVTTNEWHTKFPWFRVKPGRLIVRGRNLDGAGTFSASIAAVGSYPSTGFEPSTLRFSNGGCWKITASLRHTTIHFYYAFTSSERGICADIDMQQHNLAALKASVTPGSTWPPENDAVAAKLDAAFHSRGCAALLR